MSEKLGAVLIAEVGSLVTRVTLVDTVDGESRLIAQAEAPTSAEPPYRDVVIGVLEATVHLAEMSGRQLLQEGRLIRPQNNERDGVNHVIVTTSAAGTLELVITAIATDVSARSTLHATRCTYSNVLQTVTLDDASLDAELRRTTSWVGRQVQTMLQLRPDAILLAGGLEDGAHDVLCRLARIVGFTVEHMGQAASAQQRRDGTACPVIYAGNSAARDCVSAALEGRTSYQLVDNLRPTLEHEHLEDVRRALTKLYDEQILTRLPGMAGLRQVCSAPVTTACHASGVMTRFVAERYQRRVLTIDVGSTSSSALLAGPGRYNPAVLGLCGTGHGVMQVLAARGTANIARWLPFPIEEHELVHWLLNKQLRPHVVPTSREDIWIEQAVAREALALVFAALTDECGDVAYDLVVARGGVVAHAPHPAQAALIVLDALQPTAEHETLAVDLRLDELGLLPACGALAALDTDSAVTLFDRDVLGNMPLATCVVALGEGKLGSVALQAELETQHGQPQTVSVRHGEIVRLPLSQGRYGKLTLRPASGVRIGRNAPGAEVSSDVAAISGSALGIVIDARGRPLRLSRNVRQRAVQLWEWLAALGGVRGSNPFLGAARPEDAPVPEPAAARPVPAPVNGREVPASHAPEPTDEEPPHEELPREELPREELPPLPQEPAPPPTEPAPSAEVIGAKEGEPQKGRRVSLEDLARETEAAPQQPEGPPDKLQSDLASLRQTVEPETKRGLFGRGKDKKKKKK
jgi:hypothetical protein